MKSSYEQYIYSKEMTLNIRKLRLPCKPDLGLYHFNILRLKSIGVSGDILAQGQIILSNCVISTVIKFFKIPCPFKRFVVGNREIIKPRHVNDKNRYELGNTLYLTDKILMNPIYLTHHITFAYNSRICTSAYESTISMCNPNRQLTLNEYLVSTNPNLKKFPQNAFRTDYMNHELDDIIRYLVVEHLDGDLEQWINFQLSAKQDIIIFDYKLLSMLIMIAYTLYVLDDHLQGFTHGDLGPRNILIQLIQPSTNFWKYQIKSSQYNQNFYIMAQNAIPKLWDFSNTYIGNIQPEYYHYLSETTLETMTPFIEDFSILFDKIHQMIYHTNTHILPILESIISIKQQYTNKEMAIKFLQHPWIMHYFTNVRIPDHQVEHLFSYG